MRRAGIGLAELDLLRYIQEQYPASVRDAAEYLARTKGHTRTTALNMMERLREKDYLSREKIGGVYRYSPVQPGPQLLRGLVRDFVERVLGGSLEPFVAYLVQEAELGDAELDELKRLVGEAEARRREGGAPAPPSEPAGEMDPGKASR